MFNPLIERLAAIAEGRKTLLDAGCGEGFLLSQIGKQITGSKIIGLDISKQGIMSAEKLSAMWIVGDLARMPFSDNSFDVVFNILSPARYDEFKRVLKGGGLLLKVVPNLNYLKEIRHFYGFSAEPSSIHEGSISVFSNYFAEYESENISYRYLCDSETIKNVLDMTPMLENIDDAKKNKFLESGIREITVDLNILFTVIRK